MRGHHFHRLLIGAVIIFELLFLFWAVREYRATADATPLAMAVGSAIVTVVLAICLVRFNRNHAVLRHLLSTHGRGGNNHANAGG